VDDLTHPRLSAVRAIGYRTEPLTPTDCAKAVTADGANTSFLDAEG
jgi:hypothetical protein